jgi:hypothetical protein
MISTAGIEIMPARRCGRRRRGRGRRRGREPLFADMARRWSERCGFVWGVLDGPAGKRLAPALPQLVASLRRHGELQISDAAAGWLTGMSAATIDRRLAADRRALQMKGRSLTEPGIGAEVSDPDADLGGLG